MLRLKLDAKDEEQERDVSMLATLALAALGAVYVAWRALRREPELRVDLKRVNDEVRRQGRAALDDDVAYRQRVKDRMTQGAQCSHPPLYDARSRRYIRPVRREAAS